MTTAVTDRVRRRLAAVLVLGQSGARPAGEDAYIATLLRLFDEIVTPLVDQFDGHLVKRTAQGGLLEFVSVLEAARCALEIQDALATRNAEAPPEARLELRIGFNLGDVIIEEEDIYGDGVNIAARLESLARPGTIYVSSAAADHLQGKLDRPLTDLGPHSLKNIERPVRVFRLGEDRNAERAKVVAEASFDNRPAIAVLPFSNFSRDPEQEYFADGLTEDIIGALAAWRAFPVISRNSTFTFKGKGVDVKEAGRELGARYVVEGSVRRGGARLRVTVQLIDASTGLHLMAEKWDRDITDLFELQDEIVTTMVAAMEPALLRVERERHARTQLPSADAYDWYQRGLWYHYRHTKEDNLEAQRLFREALAVDGDYPQALAALALAICNAGYVGWAEEPERNYAEAYDLAERAVALEPRDPGAHFVRGLTAMYRDRAELAITEMQQATALNPSFAAAYVILGQLLNYAGRPAETIELAERGIRLSPHDPRMFIWLSALAGAYYQLRRYEEAVDAGRRSWMLNAHWPVGLRYVVAGLAQLDRLDEARAALVDMKRLDPSLARVETIFRKLYRDAAAVEHFLDGLRKVGFE